MKTTKRVPPAPNLACAFVYPCALACAFGLTLAVTGCGRKADTVAPAAGDATSATASANAAFAQTLPLDAPQDFEDAKRGLVARPEGQVLGADGSVLVDFDAFKFVDGAAPPTVNPSLWRHARLNAQVGLFKVTDGVYQLRGFDIANITLVEGKSGWIVIDALTCRETAAAAMAFARKHLGNKPVSALLFTHSHVDHFGGALGVVSAEEAAARKLPIVAPAGFMEEATSENIMAGGAMGRRAIYQFGRDLPRDAQGLIDGGLGKTTSFGQVGILPPTVSIAQPRQEQLVDGVNYQFPWYQGLNVDLINKAKYDALARLQPTSQQGGDDMEFPVNVVKRNLRAGKLQASSLFCSSPSIRFCTPWTFLVTAS